MSKAPTKVVPEAGGSPVASMPARSEPEPQPEPQAEAENALEGAQMVPEGRSYSDLEEGGKKFVRVPFGSQRLKLQMPEPREGFVQYLFNDWPGRVEDALGAGWKFVYDKDGKPIKRTVGVKAEGGPQTAFLMEIPRQFYEEDHARGQSIVDQIDAAIYGGQVGADEGPGDAGNRYVPKDRPIDIQSKTGGDPFK